MDQEKLKQNIAKYYSKLPSEAQGFFSSMIWMETLKSINEKYHLNEKQIETLGTETTLVLLGIVSIDDFIEIIEKELRLEKDIFSKMMAEIEENILKNVEVQLEEAFTSNVSSLVEEKYGAGQKLDERFSKLPKEVQDAINESNYQVALYTIAEKYKLTVEQMGILEELTTKVMLGIIHPDKYEEEMIAKITIPKEDISNLVKDVNEEILKTIRESLKKHWNSDSDEEIPLPPYREPITNYELKITNEDKKEDEVPLPPPNRKPITNEATKENKPIVGISDTPLNTIEEKLKGVTKSDQTVSNHSLPKINDPYREAF